MRRYWTCPKGCGGRWERSLVKCRTEGCTGRRPKLRVPKHARTLRDDDYAVYEAVNAELHAEAFGGEWTPDCCGVCGKPPSTARHMDRDHDHETGLPRGLACPGNQGCNALMPRQLTLDRARMIVGYLERAARSRSEGSEHPAASLSRRYEFAGGASRSTRARQSLPRIQCRGCHKSIVMTLDGRPRRHKCVQPDLCMCEAVDPETCELGWRPCPSSLCERTDHDCA